MKDFGRFAQGVHEEAKYLFDGLREEERVVREKQAQLAEQSKRNFEDYVKESTTLTIPVIEVLIDELGKYTWQDDFFTSKKESGNHYEWRIGKSNGVTIYFFGIWLDLLQHGSLDSDEPRPGSRLHIIMNSFNGLTSSKKDQIGKLWRSHSSSFEDRRLWALRNPDQNPQALIAYFKIAGIAGPLTQYNFPKEEPSSPWNPYALEGTIPSYQPG